EQAIDWYKKAAELGFGRAEHALAQIYMDSPAAKQDYVEAYKWILLAEKNGADVYDNKYLLEKKITPAQIEEMKATIK
ncbi:MAG TPA: hypothetical protein DCP47_08345, partial [Phycisphaerales bacterium]|nr:hypothetical protein [Phycisphaerales bacterium]